MGFLCNGLLHPDIGLRVLIVEASSGMVDKSIVMLENDQVSVNPILLMMQNTLASSESKEISLEKETFKKIVSTIPSEYG